MYAEYEQPESPKRGSETPTLLPLAPALLSHKKISQHLFSVSPACVHMHVCECFCAVGSVMSALLRDDKIRIVFAY